MTESGVTFDYGQLVIDNEIARMVKYAIGGIPVSDENLAVDVIDEIGSHKDFLSHEMTYKYMRIQSQPKLIDRRVREDWQDMGGTDLYQRASDEARRILETHAPEPLAEDVSEEIHARLEEAERELGIAEPARRS